MPTKKLFEEDSYKKSFTSAINNIDENKLILNETLFYANSGGQPGDSGVIRCGDVKMKVIDTVKGKGEQEGEIIHILDKDYSDELAKNNDILKIEGEIDWDRRYALMKNHTALHILNYFVMNETGAMVTGGQVGVDKSRMDFNTQDMTKEKMQELIDNCNEIVKQNIEIGIDKITSEEFKNDPKLVRTLSVAPPDNELIRLVKIGDIDKQACGGTHIKNTGEIKSIKLKKLQNKGKNNKRVYIIVE